MTAKSVFRKCERRYALLIQTLEKTEAGDEVDQIEKYEQALMEIDNAIREIKALVGATAFLSVPEQVYFFKEIKPLFVAQFIYYSKVLEIEVAKPNAGQHALKEYYEYELQHLKSFVDDYSDFYEYYRRKATYLDEKYFVRHQFDFKMSIHSHLYNYDTSFTTSHDHLIAQILANDRLERHLLQAVYRLEGYFFEKFSDKSPLKWTGSKSALVELLYALHGMQCFNGGNIEVSEIARFIEKSFNIDLGNFYKTFHEIKNRKTGRTKFLQALNDSLTQHFEDTDGL